MPILASLLLIFVGGCGQAFCLEYMVQVDPGCGSTITFFQFVFVALEGLKDYLSWDRPVAVHANGGGLSADAARSSPSAGVLTKLRSVRMKPLKIPNSYHVGRAAAPPDARASRSREGCVVLSWLAAILGGWAYSYRISVPFHMIFKSSILLVNMTIGVIVLGRRHARVSWARVRRRGRVA
jgi:UDP-xylose/UDP-N-acetylglucosamine transporter B4